MRTILHCDCNNFYASVECLYHPELRGKPVAVCGDQEARHGIVLAKNYSRQTLSESKPGIPSGWRGSYALILSLYRRIMICICTTPSWPAGYMRTIPTEWNPSAWTNAGWTLPAPRDCLGTGCRLPTPCAAG